MFCIIYRIFKYSPPCLNIDRPPEPRIQSSEHNREAEWSSLISCFITPNGRYSYTLPSQGLHVKDHNSVSSNLVDLAMQKVTSGYSRIHNYSQLTSIEDDMKVDYI